MTGKEKFIASLREIADFYEGGLRRVAEACH